MGQTVPRGGPRRIRLWLLVGASIVGFLAVAAALVLQTLPSLLLRPHTEGTSFGPDEARRFVAERPAALAELRALVLSPASASARQAVAGKIGALRVETGPCGDGFEVVATFSRRGLPETYCDQLRWLTPAAMRSLADGTRLGEAQVDLGDGWFWVWH